jgi:hypothetical protein
MEYWSNGILGDKLLEYWSDGRMEYWNTGNKKKCLSGTHYSIIPVLPYSMVVF